MAAAPAAGAQSTHGGAPAGAPGPSGRPLPRTTSGGASLGGRRGEPPPSGRRRMRHGTAEHGRKGARRRHRREGAGGRSSPTPRARGDSGAQRQRPRVGDGRHVQAMPHGARRQRWPAPPRSARAKTLAQPRTAWGAPGGWGAPARRAVHRRPSQSWRRGSCRCRRSGWHLRAPCWAVNYLHYRPRSSTTRGTRVGSRRAAAARWRAVEGAHTPPRM